MMNSDALLIEQHLVIQVKLQPFSNRKLLSLAPKIGKLFSYFENSLSEPGRVFCCSFPECHGFIKLLRSETKTREFLHFHS